MTGTTPPKNRIGEWLGRTLTFGTIMLASILGAAWWEGSLTVESFVEKTVVVLVGTILFGFLTRSDAWPVDCSTKDD